MVENKSLIRKKIINLRSALTEIELHEKSLSIFSTLTKLEKYKKSRMIMCYVDFKNEVQTRDFIKFSLDSNKRVCVPLVYKGNQPRGEIHSCEISNLEADLKPGNYGIYEPVNGLLRQINPQDIDLIVVPGVVFDKKRNRIGYGAGYYDRFLSNVKKDCLLVGVAFQLQVINEIVCETHDIPMDMLITEETVY